jgi:hypothetical protein
MVGPCSDRTGDILSFAISAAVRSISRLKKRRLTRGGKKFGNGIHGGNCVRLNGSASTKETNALRARMTGQIERITFIICECSVLFVCCFSFKSSKL